MIDENVLRECIADAVKEGWVISSGTYVDAPISCCCPLGAVCVSKGLDYGEDGNEVEEAINEDLGWSMNEMYAFVSGFDGCKPPYIGMYQEAFALGRKFREEFVK